MTSKSVFAVPPAEQVREKLAANMAEARYLRRLYRLAKERETADRLKKKGGFSDVSNGK
jgi:hypothetical protein